jgi:hypothetical protein
MRADRKQGVLIEPDHRRTKTARVARDPGDSAIACRRDRFVRGVGVAVIATDSDTTCAAKID